MVWPRGTCRPTGTSWLCNRFVKERRLFKEVIITGIIHRKKRDEWLALSIGSQANRPRAALGEIDNLIIKGMGGYAEPVLNHFRSPFYVARYFTGTTRNQSSMEKLKPKGLFYSSPVCAHNNAMLCLSVCVYFTFILQLLNKFHLLPACVYFLVQTLIYNVFWHKHTSVMTV